MNNIISRIEIYGFRSLDSVQIVCDSVNVFTGLNDVGKSNVLRALNLFFNDVTDLNTPINFNADYSKLSLAKAQKSNKKKQLIKIKLYFRAPKSFKSLQGEELWMEKTYDRLGEPNIKSSLDNNTSKKASLTRLKNNIKYYFIPALKGASVLGYLLGEIGERSLLPQGDIIELNQKVNSNLIDFTDILSRSSIDIKTNFELPILVKDFWQGLNINTEFDEFDSLTNISASPKGKDTKLREEFYQISLQSRGEGIKSKYIPPLLKWIQKHEPNKYFVWGIDEPENSLEFKKAQEVSDLYFNDYSLSTQIFLTSHSLAFIFPSRKESGVTIFRCTKTGKGDINVTPLEDLLAKHDKTKIAEELGALEIQKNIIEEWRSRENEMNIIIDKFNKLTQSVIYVEGSIDKTYFDLVLCLFDDLKDYPFKIESIGCVDESGSERSMGQGGLDNIWRIRHKLVDGKKIILFYDTDCNKKIEKDGNIVIFCPDNIPSHLYKKGVEHLLVLPDDFPKDDYRTKVVKPDVETYIPDKNKIKNYILSLSADKQKNCLKVIHAILIKIKQEYFL